MLEGFELMMQIADATAAGDSFIQDRSAFHLLNVLTEVPDGELLRNRNVAVVRGFLADDHAKDGGFAGAVGADKTHFLARVQLKRRFDENELATVLLVNVRKRDQKTKLADAVYLAFG
jgi:hypothetical protein